MTSPPMHHFKKPLIVTALAILGAIVIGLGIVTWIHQSDLSNRKKEERVEWLGTGLGLTTLIVIFPFWIGAASKVAKERQANQLD